MAANQVYTPPALTADIDLQSGILHADEKDYKTACVCFHRFSCRVLGIIWRDFWELHALKP